MNQKNGSAVFTRAAKTIAVGAVAGLMFLFVAGVWGGTQTASADNGPHVKSSSTTTITSADRCAGCHRAHTAQGEYLLKASFSGFCVSCHDGTEALTDVIDGALLVTNKAEYTGPSDGSVTAGATALKGGGFQYAMMNAADPSLRISSPSTAATILALTAPVATTSNHLDITHDTVWGAGNKDSTPAGNPGVLLAGTGVELECDSCHDPHGNGQYRILRTKPASALKGDSAVVLSDLFEGGVTVKDACPNTANDIPIPGYKVASCVVGNGTLSNPNAATHPGYATGDYWVVNYVQPSIGANDVVPAYTPGTDNVAAKDGVALTNGAAGAEWGISSWCSQCHQRYLAPPGAYDVDSGDTIFRYRHATNGAVTWGVTAGRHVANTTSIRPQCTQCHVAHGTNATAIGYAATRAWPGEGTDGVDTVNGGGSRLLRADGNAVCQKCHGAK